MGLLRTFPLALLFATLLAACGSAPPPEPAAPKAPTSEQAPAAAKRPVPPGQLRREDVLAVLSEGPPAFLRRVEVEPVRDVGGRFQGWRIVALADELGTGDLRAGDVVRRVNGKEIENPYQFFDVFQSLAFAPSLSVSLERDGAPIELKYPIHEDPTAAPVPRAQMTQEDADRVAAEERAERGHGAPPAGAGKRRFETKVIGGGE